MCFGASEVIKCDQFKEGETLLLDLKAWVEIYNVENRRRHCLYFRC